MFSYDFFLARKCTETYGRDAKCRNFQLNFSLTASSLELGQLSTCHFVGTLKLYNFGPRPLPPTPFSLRYRRKAVCMCPQGRSDLWWVVSRRFCVLWDANNERTKFHDSTETEIFLLFLSLTERTYGDKWLLRYKFGFHFPSTRIRKVDGQIYNR